MFAGRGGGRRSLMRMARRSLADRAHDDVLDLGHVEGARFSTAAGRDVEGWRFGIRSDAIRHVRRKHGSERERLRGQKPVTADDYGAVHRILSKGQVTAGGTSRMRGLPTVTVEHKIGRSRYFLTMEVQSGRRSLAIVTFFKR